MKFAKKESKSLKPHFMNFTLVEVTLAMAVIAVGMVGIMALFPVGLQAGKDSIGDNYSSEMADQFLHLLKFKVLTYNGNGEYFRKDRDGVAPFETGSDMNGDGIQDWDGWGEWIAANGRAGTMLYMARNYRLYDDRTVTRISENPPSAANLDIGKVMSAAQAKALGTRNLDNARFFRDDDGDGWDDIGVYYDLDRVGNNAGVFYVEARTGDIIDWDGVMYIWQEQVEYDSTGNGVADSKLPYENGTRLCMEISWPFGVPYDKRRKRVYAFEIFNTNDR